MKQRNDVYELRLFLDSRYPAIIREAATAITVVLPNNRPTTLRHSFYNLMKVVCSSKAWPALFPQHGAGRKHKRKIQLEGWQQAITRSNPEKLVRGLIHSDGCRFVAHQRCGDRVYRYPRYCFDNRSRGIMQIFCDHLDLLGIRWTMSNPESAQIARRQAVRQLDEFVGPKR